MQRYHTPSGTLSVAGPDDVVVITFAGHGSPDGNLVLFDTNAADLTSTGLSMARLADAFKTTKARAVLCVLDCCFSGQAPARVLETAARPRSAFALTGIYGEGRILLAACATNESAWEQPGTEHGLLTHAVIEVLTSAVGDSVSFPEIAGEIIRLARVEAERISVTQTPVFLGNVQGGLVFRRSSAVTTTLLRSRPKRCSKCRDRLRNFPLTTFRRKSSISGRRISREASTRCNSKRSTNTAYSPVDRCS